MENCIVTHPRLFFKQRISPACLSQDNVSLWTGAQSSFFGMTAFEIAEQSCDCFVIATYMTALESTLLYFFELRT